MIRIDNNSTPLNHHSYNSLHYSQSIKCVDTIQRTCYYIRLRDIFTLAALLCAIRPIQCLPLARETCLPNGWAAAGVSPIAASLTLLSQVVRPGPPWQANTQTRTQQTLGGESGPTKWKSNQPTDWRVRWGCDRVNTMRFIYSFHCFHIRAHAHAHTRTAIKGWRTCPWQKGVSESGSAKWKSNQSTCTSRVCDRVKDNEIYIFLPLFPCSHTYTQTHKGRVICWLQGVQTAP